MEEKKINIISMYHCRSNYKSWHQGKIKVQKLSKFAFDRKALANVMHLKKV